MAILKHKEALTELARRKVELHIQFLQKANARLKAKVAEVELPTTAEIDG